MFIFVLHFRHAFYYLAMFEAVVQYTLMLHQQRLGFPMIWATLLCTVIKTVILSTWCLKSIDSTRLHMLWIFNCNATASNHINSAHIHFMKTCQTISYRQPILHLSLMLFYLYLDLDLDSLVYLRIVYVFHNICSDYIFVFHGFVNICKSSAVNTSFRMI